MPVHALDPAPGRRPHCDGAAAGQIQSTKGASRVRHGWGVLGHRVVAVVGVAEGGVVYDVAI